MHGTPPTELILAWISNSQENAKPVLILLRTIRDGRPNHEPQETWVEKSTELFFASIQRALTKGDVVTAGLSDQIPRGKQYRIDGTNQSQSGYIQSLTIEQPVDLTLSNLSVKRIHVNTGHVKLSMENCVVAHLDVTSNGTRSNLTCVDTHIGTLAVSAGSLSHFEMAGGSLLNVECPPPSSPNPFTGTVLFKNNVFFPRSRMLPILLGPQPYRNLRHHLRSLENAQMANLIHSAELAVEREDDSPINRVLSHFYESMSDFGSSALRPLVWQFVLFAFSGLLIFRFDGAVLSKGITDLVGWQTVFGDPGRLGECARALYLALQPVVNPIGIFGTNALLVPRYGLLAVWLSLHGILSVILLALLVFAIRRRFKIQQ